MKRRRCPPSCTPEGRDRIKCGSRVVLQGLQEHRSFNRCTGTVSGYDSKRGRYFVSMDWGDERCALPCNLRVLASDAGDLFSVTLQEGILNLNLQRQIHAFVLEDDCVSVSPSSAVARRVQHAFPHTAPWQSRLSSAEDAYCTPSSASQCGSATVAPRMQDTSPYVAYLHTQWMPGPASRTSKVPSPAADTSGQRVKWLEEALVSLPSLLHESVESVAFPVGTEDTHASKARRRALASFARSNPHLRVFAVDSSASAIQALHEKASCAKAQSSKLRPSAVAAASPDGDTFQRLLSAALIEELEGVRDGGAPCLAAAVLTATCVSRDIAPSFDADDTGSTTDVSTAEAASSFAETEPTEVLKASTVATDSPCLPELRGLAEAAVAMQVPQGPVASVASASAMDASRVPALRRMAAASVVTPISERVMAGVSAASILGENQDALRKEIQSAVDASEKARAIVREERDCDYEAYRAYLRDGLHKGNISNGSLARAMPASAFLSDTTDGRFVAVSKAAQAVEKKPLRDGFPVSSADGPNVPARLLNLSVRRADGVKVPVQANIADTGAATVIMGLCDFERLQRLLPGSIKKVSPLATSFQGIRGVTGSSMALFHAQFVLDFDGVPITICDCPVLADHSGILVGVDVAGAGQAQISFEKDGAFTQVSADGVPTELPCDGFMSLRDESKAVIATLPLVHRASTLGALATAAPSFPSVASAVAVEDPVEKAVAGALPLAYAPTAIRVPAWSEQAIKCRIPAAAVGDHALAVLPMDDDRLADLGLLVAPCVQKPDSEGYIWIRVVNPSLQPVHVGPLTPLARFSVNPKVLDKDLRYTVDEILERINLERDITEKDRTLVRQMLLSRRRLFSDTLGWAHGTRQRIPIKPGAEPPNEQCRRLAPQEYAALKEEVDKQLKLRLITPVVSPFSAAPMLIAKPPLADGTPQYRCVLDFRSLNNITDRDTYPLPRVDENLARLGRAKLFTTADLLMGFHQVELEPESIPATAFSTPWGQFAYTRMPMGLTSSPSAFMRIVDATLRGLPPNIALAYCDDIIVYTDGNMEQHMQDVGAVFDKLIEGGFTVRCDKVHIGKSSVPYLGFNVGADGTTPQQKKIQPILDMCVASCQKSSKAAARFAGMIGVYQRFIPECHNVLAPFHEIRNKGADAHTLTRRLRFLAAFAHLQHALCQLTALSRPDLDKVFYVDVDAAATGAASAALSQRKDEADPTSHVPLAFWSTRLSDTQRGWPIRDQEGFALHSAMMEWRRYLLGARVIVRTDHQSLRHMLTGKLREGGRVTDWAMDLRGFDAQIEWVAGATHVVPDTLSRAFVDIVTALLSPRGGEKTGGCSDNDKENTGSDNRNVHNNVDNLRKQCTRVAGVFVKAVDKGFKVLLEKREHTYTLPSAAVVSSKATYKEQLSSYLQSQFGQEHSLINCLISSGVRMRSTSRSKSATAIFVVPLPPDFNEDLSPQFTSAGFVTLSPDTQELLSHEDDWSSLVVVEDELQGKRSSTSGLRARDVWRLSCLPSLRRSLLPQADIRVTQVADALPSVRDAPCGPAFCQSVSDATFAVEQMKSRLEGSLHPVVAVDLEGSLGGSRAFRRHIALLQICVDGVNDEPQLIYVFDTHSTRAILSASGDLSLRSLLERDDIAKVFHCCHGDVSSLYEEYGIVTRHVFDTAVADSLLNRVHFNTNRSLQRVLTDRLGEDVVKLSQKGALVHEVGMFEPRPLAAHLFLYAYEDVIYLVRAYFQMRDLLGRLGFQELWRALSELRCPPVSLPAQLTQYRHASRIVVAITDGANVVCLRDTLTGETTLPSAAIDPSRWSEDGSTFKSVARSLWQECFGFDRKCTTGIKQAVARLRKPVRIGDTLLTIGIVSSCVSVAAEVHKRDFTDPVEIGVSPMLTTMAPTCTAEQRVLFEYLAWHSTRTSDSDDDDIRVSESFVAIGPTLTKQIVAVIVHDRKHVVTIHKKDTAEAESFPQLPLEIGGDKEETARRALTKYLGPALLKGGEGEEYTTSSVLLPRFSKIMAQAAARVRLLCTHGNTDYYTCSLPDVADVSAKEAHSEAVVRPALSPALEVHALEVHASAFAAARREVNGFRLTDTDKARCAGTCIRKIEDTLPRLHSMDGKSNFDGAALASLQEALQNGERSGATTAEVALSSQHSEPYALPLGSDEEFDRLFEAAFIVKVSRHFDAQVIDPSCFVTEGVSSMPADKLPTRGDIRHAQREHPGIRKFVDFFIDGENATSYAEMTTEEKVAFAAEAASFCLTRDGLLVRKAVSIMDEPRIWLPPRYVSHVCRAYHDRLGHHGISKTTSLILERYTWGHDEAVLKESIRKHIMRCPVCRRAKVPHHKAGRGHVMSTGEHPYDILASDVYKTGLNSAGFDTVVSFACYFSRHVSAFATRGDPSSEDIVRFLVNDVIRTFGTPREVRSDHGSVFVSRAVKLLYARYGIRIAASTAYHHRTIGLVERWHSCLKALLLSERFSVRGEEREKWHEYLPLLLMAFNATVNSTTGYSPFFVIHGRHCRLPFDTVVGSTAQARELPEWVKLHLERLGVVYDAVAAKLKITALHRRRLFDLKRDTRLRFQPGDRVLLLKGKVVDGTITKHEFATEGPYLGPYTVCRVLERDNYQLSDLHTRRLHDVVHAERLVPYPSPSKAVIDSDTDYFPIRCIVGKRVSKLTAGDRALGLEKGTEALQYKVRWLGFSSSSDSWRSPHHLGNAKELVDAYERRHGGVIEELPAQSRDASIDLPADEESTRKPRFRARGERAAPTQTPVVPEKTVSPAPVPEGTEVPLLDAREQRLAERLRKREEARTAAVSSAEVCTFTSRLYTRLFGN